MSGLLATLACLPAWADYLPKGKRDPFVPLISTDGQRIHPPGSEEEVTPGVTAVTLQGIMFDPGSESYAILNGHVVREKEEFAGVKVLKIEPNRVTVLVDGQEHSLIVHQPTEETSTP